MPAPTSLPIAYPKKLIRAGLRAMLARSPVTIVGEANHAASALTLAKKYRPDVVLLDVAILDGNALELVSKHRKTLPHTQFVILSATDNPTYVARA